MAPHLVADLLVRISVFLDADGKLKSLTWTKAGDDGTNILGLNTVDDIVTASRNEVTVSHDRHIGLKNSATGTRAMDYVHCRIPKA